MTPATATRMTAEERRADVLRVAVGEFAKRGYHGTSTDDVARAAGISQPYLFKMFPTKKTLFIALIRHGFGRVRESFTAAVGERTGEDALHAMGEVYGDLLRDRDELLLQMHAYSACGDEDIAKVVRGEYGQLWREVARLSGASDEELASFFAMGMFMNVMASMDATSHAFEWVKACVPPQWLTTSWS